MAKNKVFNIRLPDDDYEFCNTMAKSVGWSLSRYVRHLIESEMSLFEFEKEYRENANVETT